MRILELCTVTYDAVGVPFLVMHTLKSLSEEEINYFFKAAVIIWTDMYMYLGDCLSGAYSLQYDQEFQSQLIQILQRGCIEMHKWVLNHPQFIAKYSYFKCTYGKHS